MLLISIALLILGLPKSETADCPSACHCLKMPGLLFRVECFWARILPKTLAELPQDKTVSLAIHCTSMTYPSDFSANAFAKFTNLRQLSITGCFPTDGKLRRDSFAGLEKVQSLQIESCGHPSNGIIFEPGIFKHLRSVDQLSITSSRVKALPAGSLCALSDLKSLNLSQNLLHTVHESGIIGCQNSLVILDLSGNLISGIDHGTFSNMSVLRLLHLSENVLDRLSISDAFTGLEMVHTIDLSRNRLSVFDQNLRKASPRLEKLDLSYNRIGQFENAIGRFPNSLIMADLSHNKAKLSPDFEIDGVNLLQLDLSYNQISTFSASFIKNAPSLEKLVLHDNEIAGLNLASFQNAGNLKILDLHRNRIMKSHVGPEIIHSLEDLRLSDNQLQEADFLTQVPNLRHLDLGGNRFKVISASLDATKQNLETLDLHNNRIRLVHKFFLNRFSKLRVMNLSENYVKEIGGYTVQDMKALEVLDLSSNNIQELAVSCFENSDQLMDIRLQNNFIQKITGVFDELPSLMKLDLSGNKIKAVDLSAFNAHLKHLNLSRNNLTDFTAYSAKSRYSLEYLDLSHNRISLLSYDAFPETLVALNLSNNSLNGLSRKGFLLDKQSLTLLDLSENQIKVITEESVVTKNPQTKLLLKGNPIMCTCDTAWIRKSSSATEILPKIPEIPELASLTCRTELSPSFPPRPVLQVPARDFLCPYKRLVYHPCGCARFKRCDCVSVCPSKCRCLRDSETQEDVVDCRGWTDHSDPVRFNLIPFYSTRWLLDGAAVEKSISGLYGRSRLREVYLNGSGIHSLEAKSFQDLKSLAVVNLSDNRLTDLPADSFTNLPNLTTLSLAHNRLQRLNPDAFGRFPSLKMIDISHNELRRLPTAIEEMAVNSKHSVFRLSGNPWKCDCDDKFLIQRWLPRYNSRVSDAHEIYCYEDANANSTNSTVLSSLASSRPDGTIKVNIRTFLYRFNGTLCAPTGGNPTELPPIPQDPENPEEYSATFPKFPSVDQVTEANPASNDLEKMVKTYTKKQETVIFIAIAISILVLVVFLVFTACFFRNTIRERLTGSQKLYKTPLAHPDMSPLSSANASMYVPQSINAPLLQFDAFVACSYQDNDFVSREIAQNLETEHPYYQLCLLYRDVYHVNHTFNANHVIDDTIIDSMAKCQRILLILTEAFLNQEWESAQIRAALQLVAKDKRRRLIAVFLENLCLDQIDPVLGQYLRTSVCINHNDPLFWVKLREALPDKSLQSPGHSDSASAYYGTIVPSDFL